MSFLDLHGWTIPVKVESAGTRIEDFSGRIRSFTNRPIVQRSALLRQWKMSSVHQRYDIAETILGIIEGRGHHVSFDQHPFSESGLGPDLASTFDSIVTGRFGQAVKLNPLSARVAYETQFIDDRWTVWLWRSTNQVTWQHIVIRSDGAQWQNGVRNDGFVQTMLSVDANGNTFIQQDGSYIYVDDLVMLPFNAAEEAVVAWYDYMNTNDLPFASLPRFTISGSMTDSREYLVLGQSDGSAFFTGTPRASSRLNNMFDVSFTLDEVSDTTAKTIPTPIHHWRMATTAIADDVGALSGTQSNCATATGKIGVGIDFNGTTSYIGFGDNVDFDTAEDFSWSFWIKPDVVTTGDDGISLIMKPNATASPYLIYIDENVKMAAKRIGTAEPVASGATTLAIGTWYHVAAVRRLGMINVYVNGALDGATQDTTSTTTVNAAALEFGRGTTVGAAAYDYFNGIMDDVAVWNVGLTANQVKQIYQLGVSGRSFR